MRAHPALFVAFLLTLPVFAEEPKRLDRFGEPLPPDAVQRIHGRGLPDVACAAHFSPDGKTVIYIDNEYRLHLWDVTGVPHEVGRIATIGSVSNVAFTPDGHSAIAVGNDATLRRFDLATATALTSREGVLPEVVAAAGDTVLARGPNNSLQVFALATLEPGPTFFENQNPTRDGAALSPDGKVVAATCGEHIAVFDAKTGTLVAKKEVLGCWGMHVRFSGTSRLLGVSIVDAKQNGQVLVLDAGTLETVATIAAAQRGAPSSRHVPQGRQGRALDRRARPRPLAAAW
jgi:WD40 repeat protein